MHSTGTGITLGLFSLLRELNNILAGNLTTVSNSKLLLSDVPTLLVVSIIALNLIRWVKKPNSGPVSSLVLGGWLGVGVLLRTRQGSNFCGVATMPCNVLGTMGAMCKKGSFHCGGNFTCDFADPDTELSNQWSGWFDETGYLAVNLRDLTLRGNI
jgi:hypothetical protein